MLNAARTYALFALLVVTLSACEDGEGFSFGTKSEDSAETESTAPRTAQTVLKDVERPDIFNVTDLGLWDGRPSLGGVWVAHPDVKTPERALLTNAKSGKSVPGALFRRERNNPGPVIQVSSEAAAALGMLAGQPAELKVLVVRQEEVTIEPEPLPIADEDTISEGELAAAGIVDDAEAGGETTTAAAKKPKRDNFFTRLFRKKPAATATVAAAGAADTSSDASAPEVETTSLDPVTTGAAAAIDRADAADKPQPRPSRTATAPAPEPTPKPSGLKNPYIQVGLFTVEANANAAAANLRQSGIVPTVREGQSNGNLSWRVLIGPVSTADDQAALLAQVKNLGYSDAFLAAK